MCTHNAAPRRASFAGTLNYVFRNKGGHEHKINLVEFIGGNTLCPDPIVRTPDTGMVQSIDLDDLIGEFEEQGLIHQGRGKKLCGHYMINFDPEDRKLSHAELLEMAREYMSVQGYDDTTKWIVVRHSDCDHDHIHIVSCLVKDTIELQGNPPNPGQRDHRTPIRGPLVSTQDSGLLGFDVMRKFEKQFGLRELDNPEDSFGHHYTKSEMKGHGGRQKAKKADAASVIRARFEQLKKEGEGRLPFTMMNLALALNKKGIEVKASQAKDGTIRGISYSADGGPWVSGSKVKKTLTTFHALQQRMGVHYSPARDNAFLGLINLNKTIQISMEITKEHYERILVNEPKRYIAFKSDFSDSFIATLAFNLAGNKDQHKMMMALMELIRMLFSRTDDQIDVRFYNNYVSKIRKVEPYETHDLDFTRGLVQMDLEEWLNEPEEFLTPSLRADVILDELSYPAPK